LIDHLYVIRIYIRPTALYQVFNVLLFRTYKIRVQVKPTSLEVTTTAIQWNWFWNVCLASIPKRLSLLYVSRVTSLTKTKQQV